MTQETEFPKGESMNVRHVRTWYVVATLAALGASFGLYKAIAAQPAEAATEQGGASARARARPRGLRRNGDFRS